MRFDPIPAEYFAEFHRSFGGDTDETFPVCGACGGACEFTKIGTLMPGEREYMASCAGLSVSDFANRFLDVLVMPDGMELDVLRLIYGCPFLLPFTCACGCRKYKVVLCEIYPIGFEAKDGMVEFEIDNWCPISDTRRFRQLFLEKGVPALSKLPVPIEWYEHVARYDDLHFDYVSLEGARVNRLTPQRFTLEELLRHERADLEHDPKVRHHPYPDEVVTHQPTIPAARPLLPILTEADGSSRAA